MSYVTNIWVRCEVITKGPEQRTTSIECPRSHRQATQEWRSQPQWLEPPMLIFDDISNRVSPRPRARCRFQKPANPDLPANLTPTHCHDSLCLQEANGDAQETAAMAQAVASPIVATATEMRTPTPTPASTTRCSLRLLPGGLLRRPPPRHRAHRLAWRP